MAWGVWSTPRTNKMKVAIATYVEREPSLLNEKKMLL